jgi:hypothetical protein
MREWTIKVFINLKGRDFFEDWIEQQPADAQESIRAIIRRLQYIKKWERPFFAPLHGHKDIGEIIVRTKDKQYRPLGCIGPGPQVFTILIGASKKSNVWTPHDAPKTAEKRRKEVFADGRYIGEYKPRTGSAKEAPSEQRT